MSVFDLPGVYARNPRGGVEHISELKALGFKWYSFNLGDHTEKEWATVISRCISQDMDVFPWMYVRTEADVQRLCSVARGGYSGKVIVNGEKPLDGNQALVNKIASETKGMDAALSVEPWPFSNIDWTVVKHLPIQAQLFPAENSISSNPRDCRLAWYATGVNRVDFMLGMHDCTQDQFPARQYGYSVYTVDDMGYPPGAWGPQAITPLDASVFPQVTPGYGPTNPSRKPQSKKSLMWKALKRALYNAGFGEFTNPDDVFNQKLQDTLYDFQVAALIPDPTGNYGGKSYEALRTYMSVNDPIVYAMDTKACEWARQAKSKGDPQPI